MLEPHPPRRDPRLLVVALDHQHAPFVALDAWELRAVGVLPRDTRARRLALWRVLLSARPSHLLVVGAKGPVAASLLRALRERALRHGLPIAVCPPHEARALAREAPSTPELERAYPELRHLVRVHRSASLHTVRVALGALLTRSLPPRRYVPGLTPRAASSVDALGALPARPSPLPHRPHDRRASRAA